MNELEARVAKLEREASERKEHEEYHSKLAQERQQRRDCNHQWVKTDNIGRFRSCWKCRALLRAW